MGSEFLFARPSVLSGVARTLDLGATFDSYNESPNEVMADARALYADWRTVGATLVVAADVVAGEPEVPQQVAELVETE